MSEKQLPEGWHWMKLGDICDINPRRPLINRDDDIPTSFVPMPAVDAQKGIINPELKPFGEIKRGYTYFQEDDILFAKITPCMENGKHAVAKNLVDRFGFGTTEFHVFRPKECVISEWVHKFLRQPIILKSAEEHFVGAVGQQRVPHEFLAGLEIPVPPLKEQYRIDAILTEQLAEIDKVQTKIQEQIEAVKQLFAAYLSDVFDEEASASWERVKLGDVCEFVGGMQPPKAEFSYTPLPNYVRLVQIQDFRRSDVAVYIPSHEAKRMFDKTDVMIGRYGPPVFQILRGLSGAYNVALMKTIPNPHKLLKDFLYYRLQETKIQSAVVAQSQRSAGQSGVQKEFLENYEIALPPLELQEEIYQMLDAKFREVKKLHSVITDTIEALDHLPAALLSQAFDGNL